VLSVEDWAEIRRLHRAEHMPIKAVARVMGCSKNTVKRALAADGPPRYQRTPRGSIVDGVEPRIRELLAAWPTMPATVIAERIGWRHSLTVLKDRVRELRPVYLPPDPASRTAYAAGEVAQCDLWFPAITLPVGSARPARRPSVLVLVTGYARWLAARLIPSRTAEDLFAGCWQLIAGLGAVPRWLVWDGEGAVGQRRRRQTILTEAAHGFRGVLGQDPDLRSRGSGGQGAGRAGQRLPGDLVSARPHLRLAGGLQRPAGRLADAGQPAAPAGAGLRPTDRMEADRAAMLALPPVAPVTGWRSSLRLPRDHYARGWTATTTRSTQRWSAAASR